MRKRKQVRMERTGEKVRENEEEEKMLEKNGLKERERSNKIYVHLHTNGLQVVLERW